MKNLNGLLIGNLNINSVSNKFDQLKLFVSDKVDILVITETKSDSTFSTSEFLIECCREPFSFDSNRKEGDVLIYVREDILGVPLTNHKLANDIEGIFVELNLRKNNCCPLGLITHLANQMSTSLIMLKIF